MIKHSPLLTIYVKVPLSTTGTLIYTGRLRLYCWTHPPYPGKYIHCKLTKSKTTPAVWGFLTLLYGVNSFRYTVNSSPHHYWQTSQGRITNEHPCIRQMEQADTLYSISPHLILGVGLGQPGLVSASRIPGLASLRRFKLLCMCLRACVCKGSLREGLAKSVIDSLAP